tara:strand:+ start:9112 stop:9405 length:294 start_codon:yes stop_codon:yes gene_type:complete
MSFKNISPTIKKDDRGRITYFENLRGATYIGRYGDSPTSKEVHLCSLKKKWARLYIGYDNYPREYEDSNGNYWHIDMETKFPAADLYQTMMAQVLKL